MTKPMAICVIGAAGRMGKMLISEIAASPDIKDIPDDRIASS